MRPATLYFFTDVLLPGVAQMHTGAWFDPSAHAWQDADWTGRQLAGSVIYELHIGTFTPEGTLDSAIARLDHLVDLGIGFVELLRLCGQAENYQT